MLVLATMKQVAFQACGQCDVEIDVRCSEALRAGDAVEFQFPNSWLAVSGPSYTRELQCTDPAAPHFIEVATQDPQARFEVQIQSRHLTFPDGPVRHGRHVVATLSGADIAPETPVLLRYRNTFAPPVAGTESVWLRAAGQAPREAPSLTVTPREAESLRIITPSCAELGTEFEVLIVSLDEHGNCSCTPYENQELLTSDGRVIAQDLSFVGSLRVPVRLDNEGVHRFRMGEAVSNAVRVGKELCGPYWGDLHIHTKLSHDGQGTDPYEYAREVSGLDFAAVADHCESLGPQGYQQVLDWFHGAHAPGRFVTLPADERNPKAFRGHHNVYFRDEAGFCSHRIKPGSLPSSLDSMEECGIADLDPDTAMLVPHHTGIAFGNLRRGEAGAAIDIDACDDQGLRPVAEIYSHHGQSELYDPQHVLAYEFNRMRAPERRANTSVAGPYYVQDYWRSGRRLGVIASSDNHSAHAGRPHGGITAVWCDQLTREAVFDAIRGRQCYATTGERILLDFRVDGLVMGACGRSHKRGNVKLQLRVWGTNTLLRVEILRHRFGTDQGFLPILSDAPRPESMDASYELDDEFSRGCMYYARVVQGPLAWPDMAWTSPIWLDED